ncbi:MAG TPA: ABC transporter permease [Candidatus Limnocylindrales bacterium]|nr:ABC transporter permease [Candidatus Limnocylindrales bacterium]
MIRRVLLKFLRRRRLARDLEEEIAFHREMASAAGNPIPFGNAGLIREQAFDLWRFNRAENLWRDLVLAVRTLRKNPGFVLAALVSLGLGIGINTAIFPLAVEFLLSEPSVRDAGSVVYVQQDGNSHMQAATINALRRSGVFDDVAGENEESFVNFNDGSETRRVFALQATKNYFTALGVPVALGRGWNESDPDEVAVLSPRFWRTQFAGDPKVPGRTIRLDGRLYTVLGILPDDYRSLIGFGYTPDVFVPTYIDGTILAAYARLKPGTTVGQVNAAMPALGERLNREFPPGDPLNRRLHATPIAGIARLKMDGQAAAVFLFFGALLVIAGLVLIIGCVNVANLLLARAASRRQEIATRLALGASRGRLLQQLLAESLLLSIAGAGLGFFLALIAAKAAASVPLPFPVPIRLRIDPDWRVAGYAAVLAVVSAVSSGLVPAWQSVRQSLSAGMHRERKLRMRRVLVIAQIAVSFVVLTTTALFLKNLARSTSLGPGFDVRHTIRADVYLPPARYKEIPAINFFAGRALDRLHEIPGVTFAAAARIIPFTDSTSFGSDITFQDNGERRHVQFNWNAVTPDYFRAMDIPVLQGRAFGPQDNGATRVVIVNDVFVRQYLGGRKALGAAFVWGPAKAVYTIAGVVRATKNMTIGENPRPQLYEPLAQIRNDRMRIQFVVRSSSAPAGQIAAVRQALRQAEPSAGLEVETMFAGIGFAFLPSQVGAALMGSIGVLALGLSLIGVSGVLAYSITLRRREIGIRVAVGATSKDVTILVLGDFARLWAAGVGIGLAFALLVTRPLAIFLVPGLHPSDPASFAAVIAVLGAAGTLAALGPARRALRVDPLEFLRCG